jgi:hypothetical protein
MIKQFVRGIPGGHFPLESVAKTSDDHTLK